MLYFRDDIVDEISVIPLRFVTCFAFFVARFRFVCRLALHTDLRIHKETFPNRSGTRAPYELFICIR